MTERVFDGMLLFVGAQIPDLQTFFTDMREKVARVWSFPSARSVKRMKRSSYEEVVEKTSIKIDAFKDKYKRTSGTKKLIVRYFGEFNVTDDNCITSVIKSNPFSQEKNIVLLDMSDEKVFDEVKKLCVQKRLSPPTSFETVNSMHYAMFNEKNKIETYMSVTTYCIKSPFRTISSIDKIVSIDEKHNSSFMVEAYKKSVLKKKGTHWVCTQAANTKKAQAFWKGRLTTSTYAYVLIGLIHIYDSDAFIYEDSTPMCS